MDGKTAKGILLGYVPMMLGNEQADLRYYIGLIPDGQERDAEDMVERAVLWAKENHRTFRMLRSLLVCEARDETRQVWKTDKDGELYLAGYSPISRSETYTVARYRGWDISTCREFKREHELYTTLSRVIMMQRPVTCRIIRTAKSKVDSVDIRSAWLEHRPHDWFPAQSVEEARELCAMGDACAV